MFCTGVAGVAQTESLPKRDWNNFSFDNSFDIINLNAKVLQLLLKCL